MLKNGIILGVIVFVLMVIKQAIFSDLNWFDVIGLSITVILASMFVEWVRKPYKYKKIQDE